MFTTKSTADIAVIGGGAAGLMSAYSAALAGGNVTVFEKNSKSGRKLRITGKGRCNLTNNCDVNEFLQNVPSNPRFLYSALNRLTPSDTMSLFEGFGVELKTERGRRVFPVSDNANDIADALISQCIKHGVKTVREKVNDIKANVNGGFTVITAGKDRSFDAVIIATGGMSYPRTGSDGDGYGFAKEFGHTVTDIKPSLVPLTAGSPCAECQGLSLKNIGFSIVDENGKVIYDDFGELMFTHFGLTGPTVLSASAHIKNVESGKCRAVIDLKPALDEKTLDARILSDFEKYKNRDFTNALSDLLPQKLIAPTVRLSGIDSRKKVNEITKQERARLVSLLKALTVNIKGTRPIDEAIITKGGVNVREVDPKTMQSKKVKGLFFAGEILDVDAYTGGYNLQIAFSTGMLAGENAVYLTYE